MSSTLDCPKCAGHFEASLVGDMKDKWLECPYCKYRVDVPDAYEVANVEETVLPDGTRRRVESSHRREDLHVDNTDWPDEFSRRAGIPEDIARRMEELSRIAGTRRPGSAHGSEDVVVNTDGEVRNVADLPEHVRDMLDNALGDINAMRSAGRQEQGTRHIKTHKVTESRTWNHRPGAGAPPLHGADVGAPRVEAPAPGHARLLSSIKKLLTAIVVLLALNMVCAPFK